MDDLLQTESSRLEIADKPRLIISVILLRSVDYLPTV
jgi:hypothetical protein